MHIAWPFLSVLSCVWCVRHSTGDGRMPGISTLPLTAIRCHSAEPFGPFAILSYRRFVVRFTCANLTVVRCAVPSLCQRNVVEMGKVGYQIRVRWLVPSRFDLLIIIVLRVTLHSLFAELLHLLNARSFTESENMDMERQSLHSYTKHNLKHWCITKR